MNVFLEVNNKTSYKISKKNLKQIAEKTILASGLECLFSKKIEISLAVVDENEIHQLNKSYRQKDRPTDVLSFCEYSSSEEICSDKSNEIYLGELILCPDDIEKKANESEFAFENEIVHITAHGVLHLLGMDHGKKMFAVQESIADEIKSLKIN